MGRGVDRGRKDEECPGVDREGKVKNVRGWTGREGLRMPGGGQGGKGEECLGGWTGEGRREGRVKNAWGWTGEGRVKNVGGWTGREG